MRVLVLHSGGMDSTVCLYKAHAEGAEVFSLGVNYGQRLAVELMFAQRHCDKLDIPREVIDINWRKPDRSIPTGRSADVMRASVSPAFLPSRNAVFLSVACAHAAGIGAEEVHTGINSIDFSGYPDCTPEFLNSFTGMMAIANPGGARISAPLLYMNKPQIASMARNFGIGEHDTWSCYRPTLHDGNVKPCGECDACLLHALAWRQAEAQ